MRVADWCACVFQLAAVEWWVIQFGRSTTIIPHIGIVTHGLAFMYYAIRLVRSSPR